MQRSEFGGYEYDDGTYMLQIQCRVYSETGYATVCVCYVCLCVCVSLTELSPAGSSPSCLKDFSVRAVPL